MYFQEIIIKLLPVEGVEVRIQVKICQSGIKQNVKIMI